MDGYRRAAYGVDADTAVRMNAAALGGVTMMTLWFHRTLA